MARQQCMTHYTSRLPGSSAYSSPTATVRPRKWRVSSLPGLGTKVLVTRTISTRNFPPKTGGMACMSLISSALGVHLFLMPEPRKMLDLEARLRQVQDLSETIQNRRPRTHSHSRSFRRTIGPSGCAISPGILLGVARIMKSPDSRLTHHRHEALRNRRDLGLKCGVDRSLLAWLQRLRKLPKRLTIMVQRDLHRSLLDQIL